MPIEHSILANKFAIATFLTADLPPSAIEKFEDQFAQGREWYNVFSVQIDMTLRSEASVKELGDICKTEFVNEDNPYHPFFFVILDEQTARDGSVLLCQQGDSSGEFTEGIEQLRISPASGAQLLTNLNSGLKSIPSIIAKHAPKDPEKLKSWFRHVPADHSHYQCNPRVSLSHFKSASLRDGFTTLSLGADHIKTIPWMPKKKSIRLTWFGKCPDKVLVTCSWSWRRPEQQHITGEC